MIQYSPEFREAALRRILPPNSEKLSDVARDLGVPVQTLCGWKKKAAENSLSLESGEDSSQFSSEEKLEIVIATAALNETELGEYARGKGLFVEQIKTWRLICSKANSNFSQECKQFKNLLKEKENEILALKQDLEKKNNALAEMTADLVLAKKCWAIWGEKRAE